MKIALVSLVLALAINSASSVCYTKPATITKYKWSHDIVTYCEFNGMYLAANSTFTDLKACERCFCSGRGLSCCGIGPRGGIMVRKKGCTMVSDICKMVSLNKAKTALC